LSKNEFMEAIIAVRNGLLIDSGQQSYTPVNYSS